MNKSELIEKIAKKTKQSKSQSELLLDAALEIIQNSLAKGEEVKLVGFGTFSVQARKSRKARNPKTGESLVIPSTRVPRFKPGKDFKTACEKN